MENLKDKSYPELVAILRDQAAAMLEQCDPLETPTVCKMLAIPGNKELLIENILKLNKDGYDTDVAISMIEREYNPNVIND
jgi:hypothetical protein